MGAVPRLRQADCSAPGITRRKVGRGFSYVDQATGERITDGEELDRIRQLAIPPAYRDVWICARPNGHLQAVGTDAAGRRQYRYHPEWRLQKDLEKFDEMLTFARKLPAARVQISELLHTDSGLTRDRVLAVAVRLLDLGFFRIGGETYAEEHETYGLATLHKRHVRLEGDTLTFDYLAKGGKRRIVSVLDPTVAEVVGRLKRRRGGGDELLAIREAGVWRDVRSADVNAMVKQLTGGDYSAKDFRTWNATVYAAVTLAVAVPTLTSKTAAKRAKSFTATQVAGLLGNTPTVARTSYIDPRVFDRFDSGWTIAPALDALAADAEYGTPAFQGQIEEAVLDLLEERVDAPTVERADVA